MATSLAEQLKKLRAPQTNLLLQKNKRASLLFDPLEAANLDKETVFEIGQNGLEELCKLSPVFDQFDQHLFARSAIGLQRSVHDATLNKMLDERIGRFLILVSPYFLLSSAQKTLEWLIHRFHIHQFNKDQFILLILPYHETRMFVRALQLVDLSDPADKWCWLKALQKPGLPLPAKSLISRIASDNGLLKLVCQHVCEATATYGEQGNCLGTLFAFYTMSLTGAIDSCSHVTENHVIHILPTLKKGLESSIPDFAAGTYMLAAKIVMKAKLNKSTVNALLGKLLGNPVLKQEVVLLTVLLYGRQSGQLDSVSSKHIANLAKLSWFPEMLADVKSSGVNVLNFASLLLASSVKCIQEDTLDGITHVSAMITSIVDQTPFSDDEIDVILRNTVRLHVPVADMKEETVKFLVSFFRSLERKYPVKFDNYLEKLVRSGATDAESQKILTMLVSWHDDAANIQGTVQILDKLHDVNPLKRIAGLKLVARTDVHISDNYRDMVHDALLARFRDDDDQVVLTLLNFPLQRLQSIFTKDRLVDELLRLVAKTNPYSPSVFGIPALRILLRLCTRNDTRVFVTVLPYLFPRTNGEVAVSVEVLNSDYAKNNNYMKMVRQDAGQAPNQESIAAAAFHRILDTELLPPTPSILTTLKEQEAYGNAVNVFLSMILLGSVCRVPVGSLSHAVAKDVIDIASKVVKDHPKVQLLPRCNQLNGDKIVEALEFASKGILPLQVGTYVLETVHRRLDLSANPVLDFEDDPDRSQLVLHFLEIYFQGITNPRWREHYLWCLKIFLKRHFANSEDAICFLSQLFAKPVSAQTSLHCLQITLSLLDSNKSLAWTFENRTFVPNLLIALTHENVDCRKSAVKILEKLCNTFNVTANGFATLLCELVNRKSEIQTDHQQLSLVLYMLLSPDPDVRGQIPSKITAKLQQALKLLLRTITDQATPIHTVAQLLELLSHVTDAKIVEQLTPLGIVLSERIKGRSEHRKFAGQALRNILERFDASTVKALANDRVWMLFESSMRDYTSRVLVNRELQPPSIVVMRQIDDAFFGQVGKCAPGRQSQLLACLIDTVTDCEISSVVAACNKVVRRIKLNAELIVKELVLMRDAKAPVSEDSSAKKKKRPDVVLDPGIVNSRAWRRGITLLEFVQRVNNVTQKQLLPPILFDVLRLSLKFEEQSAIEYTKQLLLSTIYRLAAESVVIEKAEMHVDLIAECIRTSPNPQTHHHALLVLVELFKIADLERALHNIMPIFTFMGCSVLRQDDAYSIQIISKTIETIVPIINAADNELHACEILRVFITSLPDIPEHRRGPLFVKLLQLLENHLHLFFLLTFESHVLSPIKKGPETSLQKLEFALSISHEFSPQRLIHVCAKLLEFARALPVEIDEDGRRGRVPFAGSHIFDVNTNSAKQLRHYKYTLVQFLSGLLSSPEFVGKVAELNEEESRALQKYHHALIIEIVKFIQMASTSVDIHQGKPKAKYWRVLLHWLYEVLDNVNNLLPNDVFIQSVMHLVAHESVTIRRKALDLLNVRLQQKKFTMEDRPVLASLMKPLMQMLGTTGKAPSQDVEVIEQTVLITFKLLARSLAAEDPGAFKPVLEMATQLIRSRDGPVLASAVLCLAEMCSTMRTHAIHSLNEYMPALIHLLRTKCQDEVPDVVTLSIISALQKIVEALGNFLSLYLDQLLLELTILRSRYVDAEHPKIGPIIQRLKTTMQKLSTSIPLRILLPTVADTYDKLVSRKLYNCVEPLMNILSDSFASAQPADLNTVIQDLAGFFLRVLQFREDFVPDEHPGGAQYAAETLKAITLVEESASKSLVTLVLKLSESTFRPLYYRLYDWAARNTTKCSRNITFYRLLANIAECLKSLFVLFAGHFLKHAASLLTSNNLSVNPEENESTMPLESDKIQLIEAILLTLYRVFMYDPHNFVNEERFQTLAQPLLDQLENVIGTTEDYERRAQELIIPCIANFAGAIQDDSLHRQLVYQTLLKTRHVKAHVRSSALNTIVEIAKKLGDDFMPLLPETVPFLAELLEDEDEETEKQAQEAVRTLEEVLDEPLQKYF